jgi:exopolysaccharide biosynthesis polyprenyl glycosylphosphotransferase
VTELSADWLAPAIDPALTRLPGTLSDEPVDTRPPALPPIEEDATNEQEFIRRRNTLRTRLLIIDVIAVAGAWLFVGAVLVPSNSADGRWVAAIAAAVVTLALIRLLGLYRTRLCVQRGQEMGRMVIAVVAGAIVLALLREHTEQNYGPVILAAGTCLLALVALRGIYGQWLRTQRAQGRFLRGLVMIGTNEDASHVWTMLDSEPELGYEVRAVIGEPWDRPEWEHLPKGHAIEQLPEIAQQTDASGVLLVANALSAAELHRVIDLAAANDLHVQVWPGFRGLGSRRIRRLPMSGETFFYVEPDRRSEWQMAAKRAVDLLGSIVGLLISIPVLFLAWIAIRLESGGPALYRQGRVGLDNRTFVVYKLRTMAHGVDDEVETETINERTDGPLFKATHDPRVTRVGAILRATSIDEIPQLFNVLAGTMSLVGPRPALPREVELFDPGLQRRHAVKPGITGLWQLEARDNPSFHAYRRLDLFYVDNWSIGLDLAILLATVPMVITRAVGVFRSERKPEEVSSDLR